MEVITDHTLPEAAPNMATEADATADGSGAPKAQLPDSGLENIYLHHSYFSGLLTMVPCWGHTNNLGNNSAGKSTIISLIPVFYGLEPSKVVEKSAGKSTFTQFYLPHPLSLIVFEYKKEGLRRCVLLYSREESLCYRFVPCSAAELFSPASEQALLQSGSVPEWLRSYVDQKVARISRVIKSTAEYRAVLMNTRPTAVKRLSQSDQTFLAAKFSLCRSEDQIQHLADLSAVMVGDGSRKLQRLKSMLVTCYIARQIALHPPAVRDHSGKVLDLNAARELNAQRSALEQVMEQRAELIKVWESILTGRELVLREQERLNTEQDTLKEELAALEGQQKQLDQEHRQQRNLLSDQLHEAKNSADKLERMLDKLENQKEDYDAADLEGLCARYEGRTAQYAAVEEARKQLQRLQDLAKSQGEVELEVQHQSALTELERSKNTQLQRGSKQRQEVQARLDELGVEQELALQRLGSDQERDLESLRSARESEKNALVADIAALIEQKGEAQLPTAEEQELLQSALSAQHKAVDQVLDRHEERYARTLEDHKLTVRINSRLESLHKHKAGQKEAEQILERLERLLNPPEGSPLHFIGKYLPEARESLTKVLREEVLLRRGLKPALHQDRSKESAALTEGQDRMTLAAAPVQDLGSLYGLSLDLSAVELPQAGWGKSALDVAYQEQKAQLSQLQDKVSEESEAQNKDKERLALRERERAAVESSLKSARELYESTLSELGTLEESQAAERSERVAQLGRKLAAKQSELNSFDEKTATALSELKRVHAQARLECQAKFELKRDPYASRLEEYRRQEQSLESDYQKKRAQLQQSYQAALAQRGLDPASFKAAQDHLEQVRTFYEETLLLKERCEEYRSFMAADYATTGELRAELKQTKEQVAQLERQLDELKKNHKEKVESLEERRRGLERKAQSVRNDVEAISGFEQSFGLYQEHLPAEARAAQESASLVTLQGALDRLTGQLGQAERLSRQLVPAVWNILGVIERHGAEQNKIAKLWQELLSEHDLPLQGTNSALRRALGLAELLDGFLRLQLPGIIDTLLSGIEAAAREFHNFYESLKSFNRVVDQVSQSFAAQLELHNPFSELTDIRVVLSSKVTQLQIYDRLQSFDSVYVRWEQESGTRLREDTVPEEEFLELFRQVSDALADGEINSGDLTSLVEMDVSMSENGRPVHVRNDDDLGRVSSRGLSRLAIIVLFCGLTRLLCRDRRIMVHWPLDEIGEFYHEKLIKLFKLMDDYGIALFCAQPNPSSALMGYFRNKNFIDRSRGVLSSSSSFVADPEHNPLLKPQQAVTTAEGLADDLPPVAAGEV